MKKITTVLSMIVIAMMAVTFTSCDPDADQADALLGIWQGTISNSEVYQNGYDTEIRFYGDYLTGGSGDEYDRDSETGEVYYSSFQWNIKNGTIYIQYNNTADFRDVVIYDYRFNGNYFEGYMDNTDTSHYFQLTKVVSWSTWNSNYSKGTRASGTKVKRLFKTDSTSVNK
jgi:hypothetical protein